MSEMKFQSRGPRRKSPMPTSFKTTLRYTDFTTFTPGLLTAVQVYSANSLFDPNRTGVGHQPRGFDQIMTMYDHYVVTGCRMTAILCNTVVDQSIKVAVALRDSAVVGTWRDYVEGGTSAWGIGVGRRAVKKLHLTSNTAKFLGRKSALSDPQLKGDAATSPIEELFFHVSASGIGPSVGALHIQILMEFDVVFIEPKVPVQS